VLSGGFVRGRLLPGALRDGHRTRPCLP